MHNNDIAIANDEPNFHQKFGSLSIFFRMRLVLGSISSFINYIMLSEY